jgi:hypothetical protein
MKVDVSDCTERGCRRLQVDGKDMNFDVVNDPVSLIAASRQPWTFVFHCSHQGLNSVLFPAETLLMCKLERVAVKVFTLYEMKSAVFMDTFRIRNYLHMPLEMKCVS